MSRRRVEFRKDECYHIYNRGNNSQKIFLIEENYHFFLDRMSDCMPPEAVEIQAFTLLPNHFHFSLRLVESYDISKAMQKVLSKYVRAFNRQHRRHGHGFEGRFKAIRVESNEYQDYLTRYIHRNPLEANLVSDLSNWEYSSYPCYINGTRSLGSRNAGGDSAGRGWKLPAVNPFQTLGRFATPAEYEEFVLCNWEQTPWQLENGVWKPARNTARAAQEQGRKDYN